MIWHLWPKVLPGISTGRKEPKAGKTMTVCSYHFKNGRPTKEYPVAKLFVTEPSLKNRRKLNRSQMSKTGYCLLVALKVVRKFLCMIKNIHCLNLRR